MSARVSARIGGGMRRFTGAVVAALLLSVMVASAALRAESPAPGAQREVLQLAVFPYLSPRKLVRLYLPLKTYLAQRLGRTVRIVTAPDYATFVERVGRGELDLVVNASHMARLAQIEAGYRPLLRPRNDLSAVVVVSADSPVDAIGRLAGGALATPSPLAQITMIARALVQDAGLAPATDLRLVTYPTHGAALSAVLNGLADAAAVSSRALEQLRPRLAAPVRVVADSRRLAGAVPGTAAPVVYLAGPGVPAAEAARLQHLIVEFVEGTEAGRRFIEPFGYGGLRPLEPGEMERLDAFLPSLRRELQRSTAP